MQQVEMLVDWIRTPSWSASKAYAAEHPELLDEATDDVVRNLLVAHPGDTALVKHQALLQVIHAEGLDTAYAPLLAGELLQTWMAARSWEASRDYLREHKAELTGDLCRAVLATWLDAHEQDDALVVHGALQSLTLAGSEDLGFAFITATPADRQAMLDQLPPETPTAVLASFVLLAQTLAGSDDEAAAADRLGTAVLKLGENPTEP